MNLWHSTHLTFKLCTMCCWYNTFYRYILSLWNSNKNLHLLRKTNLAAVSNFLFAERVRWFTAVNNKPIQIRMVAKSLQYSNNNKKNHNTLGYSFFHYATVSFCQGLLKHSTAVWSVCKDSDSLCRLNGCLVYHTFTF